MSHRGRLLREEGVAVSFIETVERARALLERNGRLSLRALQREFGLRDEVLEDLVEELVDVQQVAAREGKVLSWIGAATAEPSAPEPERQATPEAPSEPAEVPQTGKAERRQLTVMFCDLVGSTALSKQLDPEEFREVVGAYQQLCGEVIARHDAYLAKYLGDGVLIYFGYPQAHEDDPVRSVNAALEILAEIPALNARLQERIIVIRERPVAVRIGMHTGLVVVGEMGEGSAREAQALGDTPNLAARLQ